MKHIIQMFITCIYNGPVISYYIIVSHGPIRRAGGSPYALIVIGGDLFNFSTLSGIFIWSYMVVNRNKSYLWLISKFRPSSGQITFWGCLAGKMGLKRCKNSIFQNPQKMRLRAPESTNGVRKPRETPPKMVRWTFVSCI